eukprot:scaffold529_cov308-Pinguiococcus_pyrenoidosus.AAC.69
MTRTPGPRRPSSSALLRIPLKIWRRASGLEALRFRGGLVDAKRGSASANGAPLNYLENLSTAIPTR